ncbi:MAG: NUDIX domain-containing protein [bacterium]
MISEQVLAISEKTFKEAGSFIGYKKYDPTFYKKILSNIRFVNRDDAEKDENYKQIIPYIVIKNEDNYFVMQRLPRSGEKRLHNAFTFGVGGHINPADSTSEIEGEDVIERGMRRELDEEVWVESLGDIKLVGFMYDDKQEVSRHHIGFVYSAEAKNQNIKVLEEDKLKGFFVAKEDLPKYIDGKENWAEIVYEEYIQKL